MNTFLARTGSNSTCFLASHYHVGVCNLGGRVPPPLDLPLVDVSYQFPVTFPFSYADVSYNDMKIPK